MKVKKFVFTGIFTGVFILSIFLSLPALSQTSSNVKVLTDSEKVYGLSTLCTEVKYNFAFYQQLAFDWDSLCYASIANVLATKSVDEYTRELQYLCARLGDGHTMVYNEGEIPPAEWIKPLPFTTRFLDGKIVVDEIFQSGLLAQGIVRGVEIVTIEGMPAREYGDTYLLPYLSSSSPQWDVSGVYEGFAFTKDRISKDAALTFRSAKGEIFTRTISRNMPWDIQRKQGNSPYLFHGLPGNVGVLKIRHFNDNGMQKVFDKMYEESILSTDALIIDLRNNSGGNSLNAEYILRHFFHKPFRGNGWSSPMYIAAHTSWNYPPQYHMEEGRTLWPVRKEIYQKPVIVLVNGGTFSSSEDFCAIFRGMKRGKIIGTPTAGSTGNAVRKWLIPNLIRVNICSKKEISPDGTSFIGTGIYPDIEVKETFNGFLKENDELILKALELLKE